MWSLFRSMKFRPLKIFAKGEIMNEEKMTEITKNDTKKRSTAKQKVFWIIASIVVLAIIFVAGFHRVDAVNHPAETHIIPEVSHTVNHPAKTHTVKHPAQTHTVGGGCVTATEGNYAGNCATARCADGSYTGANPYYSLTCNYHGGVVAVGPFTNPTKTVVDKAAWTETITDKAAYSEKVIDTPAKTAVEKEAYTTPGYDAWYGIKL